VKRNPPTLADFISNAARGAPAPAQPELARLWDGVSSYNTAEQARRSARRRPMLGRYIAELRLPEDRPLRLERTLKSSGHHTLWAEPSELLALVVRVEPV
jgi:hypothetical protein